MLITLSNKGSSTGPLYITGLPFTSNSTTGTDSTLTCFFYSILASITQPIGGYITTNASALSAYRVSSGGLTQIIDTDLTNISTLVVSGTYLV